MRVRIVNPSKSAMQSRCQCGAIWRIEPVLQTPRQKHPLTGWEMADDAYISLCNRLIFATSGEALTFVRARGWEYEIDVANERKIVPKSYLDNFNPDRRRSGR